MFSRYFSLEAKQDTGRMDQRRNSIISLPHATRSLADGFNRNFPPHVLLSCAAIILDICAIISAALLASVIAGNQINNFQILYEKTIFLMILNTILLLGFSGSYQTQFFFLIHQNLKHLALRVLLSGCAAIGVMILFSQAGAYSIMWLSSWVALSVFLVLGFRILLALFAKLDPQFRMGRRTVIIGGGENGQCLMQIFQRLQDQGLVLIGYADDRNTRHASVVAQIPFLGSTSDIFPLIRNGLVDQIIIALPWSAHARTVNILQKFSEYPVCIRLAPDLINYHLPPQAVSHINGMPLVHLVDRPISGWSQAIKRIEDIVLSALAVLVLAVPMLLIAAAIRLDTPGPILFRQRRVGFNDQKFEVLKFRTMHHHQAEHSIRQQASLNDARITRVGFWLRRLSLDELPQIFNVLRGDMAFVGPRPHAPGTKAAGEPFEDAVSFYAARHRVKPGITGLAQVRGYRGQTETIDKIHRRVESDIEYIENWSLFLDLTIIARTIFTVLRMKNAW